MMDTLPVTPEETAKQKKKRLIWRVMRAMGLILLLAFLTFHVVRRIQRYNHAKKVQEAQSMIEAGNGALSRKNYDVAILCFQDARARASNWMVDTDYSSVESDALKGLFQAYSEQGDWDDARAITKQMQFEIELAKERLWHMWFGNSKPSAP